MKRNFGIKDSTNRMGKKLEIKKDRSMEKKEPKPRVPIMPKIKNVTKNKKAKKPQRSIVEANKVVMVKIKASTSKNSERRFWMP